MPVMEKTPPIQVGHTDSAIVRRRLEGGEDLQIVDVREPWEHAQGVIEGAILMPWARCSRGGRRSTRPARWR